MLLTWPLDKVMPLLGQLAWHPVLAYNLFISDPKHVEVRPNISQTDTVHEPWEVENDLSNK
jgi:hypothetical protein